MLFEYLNSWAGRYVWMDPLIIFKAEYLGWWMLGGLGAFLVVSSYFRKGEIKVRWMVLTAVLAGIVSRSFTEVIRFFYPSARPFEILDNVYQLVSHSGGESFPSGHAAFFFALAAGVFIFYRGLGVLFFALALSISVDRVISGIHWPSDILGGAVLGIFSAYLVYCAILFYRKRQRE